MVQCKGQIATISDLIDVKQMQNRTWLFCMRCGLDRSSDPGKHVLQIPVAKPITFSPAYAIICSKRHNPRASLNVCEKDTQYLFL
jgi:hypothetical protein